MALQQLLELVLQGHPGGAEDSAYVAARPLPAASSSAPRPEGPGAAAAVLSVGRRNQALAPQTTKKCCRSLYCGACLGPAQSGAAHP